MIIFIVLFLDIINIIDMSKYVEVNKMDELYQRISRFRNALGITQTQLAKKLCVTRSAVNAWEMGVSTPQLKHVIAMAEIFHTTVDGLLNTENKTVIDISDLSEQAQDTIINMVDCLKNKTD